MRHCKAPEVDFPAAIAGGVAADSLAIADMEWWRFYGDSILCNIIRHTLANNKDMLAAAARVERMAPALPYRKAERLAVGVGNGPTPITKPTTMRARSRAVTPNLAPRLP